MFDTKTQVYAKILVVFALAVMTYVLLTPAIIIYEMIISGLFSCTNTGFECDIVSVFFNIIVPISALFFSIWELFEVFKK